MHGYRKPLCSLDVDTSTSTSLKHAGLGSGIAFLAATGPLVSLRSIPWWWSLAEVLFAVASLCFLGLTCATDPGVIPHQTDPDPLVAKLDAHAALTHPGSVMCTVVLEDATYRLMRLEHAWTRLAPGSPPSLKVPSNARGSLLHSFRTIAAPRGPPAGSSGRLPLTSALASVNRNWADIEAGLCPTTKTRQLIEAGPLADGGQGYRYCTTCNIWRPPHAHHCKMCNQCVTYFDHHCDLLGCCIAELNHRWFTLFLLCALACTGLLLAGSSIALFRAAFQRAPSPCPRCT